LSKLVDSNIWSAAELPHNSNNHLLADGKSHNVLAAAYLYFAAIYSLYTP